MDPLLLQQAAGRFGLQAADLSPMTGGNFSQVYEYQKNGQTYVLRITPPDSGIEAEDMRSIQAWMSSLSASGADVPLPVRSQSHQLVEEVDYEGERFLVSGVEKAAGVLADSLTAAQWNDGIYSRLGQVTGKMHALSMAYMLKDVPNHRPNWYEAGNCFNPEADVDESQPLVREQRRLTVEAVLALPQSMDSYGLIHADLHCANIFVDPETGRVTLFDFDDCAYGWYVMDIAMLALDMDILYGEQGVEHFLTEFLHGYLAEKSLGVFWVRQMPLMLKLLETGLYADLYRHAEDAEANTWVGRFLAGRRERIEAGTPFLTLDFEKILAQAGRQRYGRIEL